MFLIEENKMASAFYTGGVDTKWLQEVSIDAFEAVKAGFARIPALLDGIKKGIGALVEGAKAGWNFFAGWFRDDPVGAIAGGLSIVGVGVALFMGGTMLGAVVGGLGGLAGLKALALSAATAGVNALLGNPLGKCVRFLVRGAQFLYNFDWNQSDEEFKKEIDSSITALYGVAGQTLGTALGATICGVLPGVTAIRMNLTNVAAMWEIINDEIKDEVLQQFNALLSTAKRILAENMFKSAYVNVRRWIKTTPQVRSFIKSVMPGADKVIEGWGASNSKPFTFAKVVEDAIDGIKDAVENFMDSCTESLLAVSYAL